MSDNEIIPAPTADERLENIEQYLAQMVGTDKSNDTILSFSLAIDASPATAPAVNKSVYISATQKVAFDIPEETPYILIPETPRAIALYRDNDTSPFALVDSTSTRSFRLPRLTRLTVEVLPGTDTGIIIFNTASRPFEIGERLNSAKFRRLFPYQQYTYQNVTLRSPLLTNTERFSKLTLFAYGVLFSGVTGIIVRAYGVDDTMQNPASFQDSGNYLDTSSYELMSGWTAVAGALANGVSNIVKTGEVYTPIPRYFYVTMALQGTVVGTDNAYLKLSYMLT